MNIIIAHIDIGDMFPWAESPIVDRRPVSTKGDADINSRPYGRPAIIAPVFSPGDPGRSPFISRRPHPSIGIVVKPVPIMKGGPAPTVIGYPGPAFLCVDPVSAAAIRTEATASCGNPYISIIRVAHPGAIRAELIIKDLEADACLCMGVHLSYPGNKTC
jgi:hypothetical protein